MQNMSFAYLQRRGELVNTALAYARSLGLKDEVAHDAMLLMDRTMSTSLQVCLDLELSSHCMCFCYATSCPWLAWRMSCNHCWVCMLGALSCACGASILPVMASRDAASAAVHEK